jgi:hypothetical protein
VRESWKNRVISIHENEIDKKDIKNLEIEIRILNITPKAFLSVYNYIKTKDHKTEQSINAITSVTNRSSKTRDNHIRKLLFENGKKLNDEYILKSPLFHNIVRDSDFSFTVGISKETPISSANTDATTLYRVKYRKSLILSESLSQTASENKAGLWRLDITKVKELKSNSISQLGKIKDSHFAKKYEDIEENDKLEVEIEYLKPERIIKEEDFVIIQQIMQIIDPEHSVKISYQSAMSTIMDYTIPDFRRKKYIESQAIKTLKHVTTQVIGLNKNTYSKFYPPIGYYLTDKADGIHSVIIAKNGLFKVLTDTAIEISHDVQKSLIADGELIWSDDHKTFKLFIFDVMMFDGQNIAENPFRERKTFIPKCIEVIRKGGIDAYEKQFICLSETGLKNEILTVYNKKREYEIDGLIFNSPGENYHDTRIYKWKPYDHNTIDFLAKKCPSNISGVKPYEVKDGKTLYFLFSTISFELFKKFNLSLVPNYKKLFPTLSDKAQRFPIQFSPSDNPLAYLYWHPNDSLREIDNQIVELTRNKNNTEWILTRIREDRTLDYLSGTYFGNAFQTAEDNWQNFSNPFPIEELYNLSTSYFQETKKDVYRAPMGFNSYVKTVMTSKMENAKYVIDLAIGRGADLRRYMLYNVDKLIGIDLDENALTELIQRKYDIMRQPKSDKYKTSILTIQSDINDSKKTLEKIYNISGFNTPFANHVVCQFAIHYFIHKLPQFIGLISSLLAGNGCFSFTCFNGQRVFDLLTKNKGNWLAKENETVKYQIKSKYSSKKLTSVGQKIGLLLPFSSSDMYEESLVNVDFVIGEFKKKGYRLVNNTQFSKMLPEFRTINFSSAEAMTENDELFVSLYDCVVLQKIPSKGKK